MTAPPLASPPPTRPSLRTACAPCALMVALGWAAVDSRSDHRKESWSHVLAGEARPARWLGSGGSGFEAQPLGTGGAGIMRLYVARPYETGTTLPWGQR